jgi:hypothetical protein
MGRGRASGDAATHDRYLGALLAGEGPEPERRSRAGAVGRVRRAGIVVQGKMHGPATVRHFQVCRTGCVASDFFLSSSPGPAAMARQARVRSDLTLATATAR